MKWHLYKKDDPNTWPEYDCPTVVMWKEGKNDYGALCRWNNKKKRFYNKIYPVMHDECYYAYIAYIPVGYNTFTPTICTNKKHGYMCDQYDDGYCMYRDFHSNCEYQKTINEYSVETKRIWKEFE